MLSFFTLSLLSGDKSNQKRRRAKSNAAAPRLLVSAYTDSASTRRRPAGRDGAFLLPPVARHLQKYS
jgi:hypothetical protein